jgi:hypothetical protein
MGNDNKSKLNRRYGIVKRTYDADENTTFLTIANQDCSKKRRGPGISARIHLTYTVLINRN